MRLSEALLRLLFHRVENLNMLARVWRGDVALAVVALVGLAAGTVLTVVKALGVTGPLLVVASIVVAAAAVPPQVRSQVIGIIDQRKRRRRFLDAILMVPITPLSEIDPFSIGIFRSELAWRAWRDGAGLPVSRDAVPPYVPRRVDAALRGAVAEPHIASAHRLVVLRGDPESGKSRSLWEAIRELPERRLVAVSQPDAGTDPSDPRCKPLKTLAELDPPVSSSQGRDLVIWVENTHLHLGKGLDKATLRELEYRYPRAVIAMTIHSHVLEPVRYTDPELYALLRQSFGEDALIVGAELCRAELASAKSVYPALAGHPSLVRLPALFAGADLLIDRYRHHRADQPFGVAVTKAATAWERAGMPPGSIDEPTLRKLAELMLAGFAPNREMNDLAFAEGLEWAMLEVAGPFTALILREPGADEAPRRFRAFDAVVSWALLGNEPPVDRPTWDFVAAAASDHELPGVGIAAYLADEPGVALDAFDRASSSASSVVAAGALVVKGVVLGQLGRHEEELAAYDQVIERFGGSKDPALAETVVMALRNAGSRLRELGREEEAAAKEQTARSYTDSGSPGDGLSPDEVVRTIFRLAETFFLLKQPSLMEALRARLLELEGQSPDGLAARRPSGQGPPGLGYGRSDDIDGIVAVIAWSVVNAPRISSRRIRWEAEKRRLRPEVGDALARFLSTRLRGKQLENA